MEFKNITIFNLRHGDHDETDRASDVIVAKGVTMVALCSISVICGLFPILLSKWLKWNSEQISPRSVQIIGLLLGFGGGVLFSTTFLHLLPEVIEGVDELVEHGSLPKVSISLAILFMCSGFFVIYFVEELVHLYIVKTHKANVTQSKKNLCKSDNDLVEAGQINGTANSQSNALGHGHSHLPPTLENSDDFLITSLRGLLIVLGLSVHELFEGLAIGLESSASSVWYMFGAVSAHKFVIAFCIGVELVTSKTKRYLSIIYISIFAVVSSIGIAIGIILVGGSSAVASGPAAIILQGFASGTLLYIVFFEILQKYRTGLLQFFAILIGFFVMLGIKLATESSHTHSH
ncbi:zinc transporter ZIP1 [Cephus cinctus]|uniref:Zinc transporter ZIP1 n=1 Tax=Cephus cinctus TaxID=211228 RepID=A0AAJ7FG85_CEPCN|nr:zinc transporter ZIP1 [Cephus cinctus]